MDQVMSAGVDTAAAYSHPIATSVHRAVFDRIRSDILRGRIAGGVRLHQSELARTYGVSITPVREALRDLAAEGLVDVTVYAGAVVHQPTLEELEQIYKIRASLLPLAVKEAVARITPAELYAADQLITSMSTATSPEQWLDGNRRLHYLFDEATRNAHLTTILRRLGDVSTLYVNISLDAEAGVRDADEEHRAILDAYRAGNKAAVEELTIHHFEKTLEMSRARLSAERIGSEANQPHPQ
jgi:DNA-binding GntR family transcriptional regulator